MKKTMIIALIVIVSLLGITLGFMSYNRILPIGLGMHQPVFQTYNIALEGYDVTSYYKNQLVKGDPKYSLKMQGVIWHFSSEENRDEFRERPEKFMPQYGGYCTKAISTGFTAPADPSIYTLHDGKLYIFSSHEVKDKFLDDPHSLIQACNKKWK